MDKLTGTNAPGYRRNNINRYTLPRYWGEEKRAAADGTQYELAEENLLAEKHIRYGGYGGIAYHHVSDMYILLFNHFISCGVFEAIYILDGLIRNRSDISPTTIHADSHGQNLPVFGLSYLLGIELLPRIRNWKDLKFYRPKPVNPNIQPVGEYNYSGGRLPFSVFFVFGPSLLRGSTSSFPSPNSISALTRINIPLPSV
jgi:TnpA family transposase